MTHGRVGQGLRLSVGGPLYVAVIALVAFAYTEVRVIGSVEDNEQVSAEALARRGGQPPQPMAPEAVGVGARSAVDRIRGERR